MDQRQWQDFLSSEGAIWEDVDTPSPAAHFPATEADLHLVDLSPLGTVSVEGPDSQKFLQGQLTCDLVTLPDNHSTLGAHCNPKGRMISAFSALKLSHSEFFLRLPRDLAPIARDTLGKYAVFFKTELQDIGDRVRWLGLQGRNAPARASELLGLDNLTEGELRIFDCGGERAIAQVVSDQQVALLVPAQESANLWQRLTASADPAGYCHWLQQQIAAGIPQLHAETSEMFIPQMTNLHLLGGVSFKKGCYTGQEVVARMQYRGAAKRRLYRARCTSGEIPAPGLEIYGEGKQSIGNLVVACRSEHGTELLAVLTIGKVAADEELRLADGRELEILELPYDAEADPLA